MFNRSLAVFNPFREMEEMERRFFGEPFAGGFGGISEFKTDIRDEGDSFLLEADLPGFDKKDIALDVNGDVLTVRAERHSEHEKSDKRGKYVCCERSYGSYSRSFDMSGIKTDNITAKFENGVLSLTLPKKDKILPESRRLEIQ